MPRRKKTKQTVQTTFHLSLTNRLYIETRSEKEGRSLTEELDRMLTWFRTVGDAICHENPQPHQYLGTGAAVAAG